MNDKVKEILKIIEEYLEINPSIRFTQALFNLGINEFEHKGEMEFKGYSFRDNYNDLDINVLEKLNNKKEEWNS